MNGELRARRREVLAITAGAALLPIVGQPAQAKPNSKSFREIGRNMPFDDSWLFLRGEGQGLDRPEINDEDWRKVDLPHDWSIEDVPGGQAPDQLGPFDKNAVGQNATGFTVGGEGWYRKHFRVDAYPSDARVEVLFGGAYLETDVWLNGHHLGRNVHGYIPFTFDLTPYLNRSGDNVLAVRVRNLGKNTRWYAGSGLYRQVSLDVLPGGTRLARWGVAAWTKRLEGGRAEIEVTTAVEAPQPTAQLVTRLRDSAGAVVAEAISPASAEVKQNLVVRGPKLWSPESPALYTLESELRSGTKAVDRLARPFGIRIVTFDAQRGMTINGKAIKLYGGCIHHDTGLLGARAFADADERRIRLLKARGFNAVRSSHNPSAQTLRDACDRQGMLLIEEAFDVWHERKEPEDFASQFSDHWEDVIRAMVLPARNSPSVIMWSIGNEIPGRSTDEGVHWSWTLLNTVKRLDQTRPVTAGLNGVLGQEMIAGQQTARPGFAGKPDNASTIFIDIPGYNYRLEEVQREFATHPARVVYASETFPKNVFDYARLMEREPAFLGEFVWTAMDYIGEAGVGASARLKQGSPPFYLAGWPWVNAWCGDLDLIGFQKPQSFARDVAWGLSPLEVTVQRPVPDSMFEWVSSWGWPDELQSWSWPGSEGKPLSVRVFTSADRVELRLNGATVGEKQLTDADKMQTALDVAYVPGLLEVVAWKGGREVARRKLETTGPAARLRVAPEQASVSAHRQQLVFVPIEVVDAKGRLLPDERRPVSLKITGPAELAAFGSAEPFAVGSFHDLATETFRGRALAVLRSTGQPGNARIEVHAEDLPATVATVFMR